MWKPTATSAGSSDFSSDGDSGNERRLRQRATSWAASIGFAMQDTTSAVADNVDIERRLLRRTSAPVASNFGNNGSLRQSLAECRTSLQAYLPITMDARDPVMPAEEDPAAMDVRDTGSPQQFCLRWHNYQNNLTNCFDQLRTDQFFVDVTLACDGQSLKAHKVVLSACSPYFQALLVDNPCQHPIIIIRDIKYEDLKAAVDFMYRGEINVSQEQIPALLKVADTLKIRGLTDVNGEQASLPGDVPARGAKRAGSPVSPEARRRRGSEEPARARSPQGTPPADPLPRPEPSPVPPHAPHDDVDIRPGIAEMIREEERARMLENTQAWMGASTSTALAEPGARSKMPRWTEVQLQQAVEAVVTQKMRFTQAATRFAIPKGTLYDNILGKSNRMAILGESGITEDEERDILNFCCDINVSPYNRRTNKSLKEVLEYVEKLIKKRDANFLFGTVLKGYRWWWAFCKKNSIVSLCFDGQANGKKSRLVKVKLNV